MSTNKRFWDRISERYDHHSKRYYMSYNKTIKHVLASTSKDSTLLEVGCGTGTITTAVAPYIKHITSVDISDKMLKVAQKKADALQLSNITFLQSTGNEINTKAHSYDTLLLINILHFVEDPEQMLAETSRLLKPDGLIIAAGDCFGEIYTFHQQLKSSMLKVLSYVGIIPKMHFYTRLSFRQLFEQHGFTIYEEDYLHRAPLNYYMELRKN